MPKVECLAHAGLDAWFDSNDHLPPHIHVEKPGHWEIRVFFLEGAASMIEVKWGKGRKGKERRTIVDAVAAVRADLLVEWSQKVLQE